MMNIKKIGTANLIKVGIVMMVLIIVLTFIKSLPLSKSVQAFSIANNSDTWEDIYKTIINKAVPMLDVAMGESSDEKTLKFDAYTLFKYVTKIDFRNPTTYLLSEIPLLGIVDFTTFNGNVGGMSGSSVPSNVSNKPQENNEKGSFDDKPVKPLKVDPDKPAVAIYHTHTTESFTPTVRYDYEAMGDHRTTDRNYNICKIGEEIKNYIETYYGFSVIHDMTLHDYPYYEGSYDRSKPTMENLIKNYPDVNYIIDVHRDAFPDDEAARKNMVIEIDGVQAAKIMFVIGKSNPHWQENYYMAMKLNQKIEELYPGLSKGILVNERSIYNQDISNKTVLIEIGADCNTLEESLISAKMVARALGQLLKSN